MKPKFGEPLFPWCAQRCHKKNDAGGDSAAARGGLDTQRIPMRQPTPSGIRTRQGSMALSRKGAHLHGSESPAAP